MQGKCFWLVKIICIRTRLWFINMPEWPEPIRLGKHETNDQLRGGLWTGQAWIRPTTSRLLLWWVQSAGGFGAVVGFWVLFKFRLRQEPCFILFLFFAFIILNLYARESFSSPPCSLHFKETLFFPFSCVLLKVKRWEGGMTFLSARNEKSILNW